MKTTIVLTAMALFSASTGFASEHKIESTTTGFSAPANAYLNIVQTTLAVEAIKLCGSSEAVLDINNINIRLASALISEQLSRINMKEFGPELNLIYPKVTYSAVVTCAD